MPEVMTLDSFISYVKCGAFINDDGTAYYGTDAMTQVDIEVLPSDVEKDNIDHSYTHIFWYNV